MRRPHVYERSAPRPSRSAYQEPQTDPAVASREIVFALVNLIAKAELSGLATLAACLQSALVEAETAEQNSCTLIHASIEDAGAVPAAPDGEGRLA